MQFITNTKPLADALNLAILTSNISRYFQKSYIVQLTANSDTLSINVEYDSVLTEISLKGSGDSSELVSTMVDSNTLRQLINTLETATVTLCFTESGLTVLSGKSKFSLPRTVDENIDMNLTRPISFDPSLPSVQLQADNWKFVKDHQMFAVAMSYAMPLYRLVWVGDSGDVLVGDMKNSIFTHTSMSNLSRTCMLADTIINIFVSAPENTEIQSRGDNYILHASGDSFDYTSQIIPAYESEQTGSYNADIIMSTLDTSGDFIRFNPSVMSKLLSQADLLAASTEEIITLGTSEGSLHLHDSSIDGDIEYEGSCDAFSIDFKRAQLKDIISNYNDSVNMHTVVADGEVVGLVFWDENLTICCAGVDD